MTQTGSFKTVPVLKIIFILVLLISAALCEQATWDCPVCGKTGNTGEYCGGCANPMPVQEKTAEPTTKEKLKQFRTIGNIVTFGNYPQTADSTDNTPIEWQILDVQGDWALLISRYGLDAMPYSTDASHYTWETCTLRNWLNNNFYYGAFSAEEQAVIRTNEVDNGVSQGFSYKYGTDLIDGNKTVDKIFLFSYEEARQYFTVRDMNFNIKSRVAPTAYALKNGAGTISTIKTVDDMAAGWWWLRSPGNSEKRAARIDFSGAINSYSVSSTTGLVRPALWLYLKGYILK